MIHDPVPPEIAARLEGYEQEIDQLGDEVKSLTEGRNEVQHAIRVRVSRIKKLKLRRAELRFTVRVLRGEIVEIDSISEPETIDHLPITTEEAVVADQEEQEQRPNDELSVEEAAEEEIFANSAHGALIHVLRKANGPMSVSAIHRNLSRKWQTQLTPNSIGPMLRGLAAQRRVNQTVRDGIPSLWEIVR